jgi:hypothetical protein
MGSLAATLLMWVNAVFIVALTMIAYGDAVQRRMQHVRTHLRIAGVLAVATALLSTVVLYENRSAAAEEIRQLKSEQQNASWNAYPPTVSRAH